MPKFEVTVIDARDLVFVVEALNKEDADVKVHELDRALAKSDTFRSRTVEWIEPVIEPHQIAFKLQLDNIRRDYQLITEKQKLPSGEIVDDATAETIRTNLITLYNALAAQSGIECEPLGDTSVSTHLGETIEFFKEKLGDPTKFIEPKADPTSSKPAIATDLKELMETSPEVIWERCATACGWHWDADYKGWVKPSNKKPGSRPGDWDAYQRDMTAEDACNEEGIESLEEAAEALSA